MLCWIWKSQLFWFLCCFQPNVVLILKTIFEYSLWILVIILISLLIIANKGKMQLGARARAMMLFSIKFSCHCQHVHCCYIGEFFPSQRGNTTRVYKRVKPKSFLNTFFNKSYFFVKAWQTMTMICTTNCGKNMTRTVPSSYILVNYLNSLIV